MRQNITLENNQSLQTSAILTEVRPWGKFEILLDNPDVKVKRITVDPGQRLSYQYHEKRSEVWTVVSGMLTIVLDGDKLFRGKGQSVRIRQGDKHRAWNETDKPVVFIEVQTGTYFGEDDIIRIEDDYKRN
jgi:mannose-6-phosphate isomerase